MRSNSNPNFGQWSKDCRQSWLHFTRMIDKQPFGRKMSLCVAKHKIQKLHTHTQIILVRKYHIYLDLHSIPTSVWTATTIFSTRVTTPQIAASQKWGDSQSCTYYAPKMQVNVIGAKRTRHSPPAWFTYTKILGTRYIFWESVHQFSSLFRLGSRYTSENLHAGVSHDYWYNGRKWLLQFTRM